MLPHLAKAAQLDGGHATAVVQVFADPMECAVRSAAENAAPLHFQVEPCKGSAHRRVEVQPWTSRTQKQPIECLGGRNGTQNASTCAHGLRSRPWTLRNRMVTKEASLADRPTSAAASAFTPKQRSPPITPQAPRCKLAYLICVKPVPLWSPKPEPQGA